MSEEENPPLHPIYPNLIWALGNKHILSSLCSKGDINPTLLKIIDEKIESLRRLGCKGIHAKFKNFDMQKIYPFFAELEVADLFLKKGYQVTLLDDDYFHGPSPDILVITPQSKIFVEVTHISTSDPGAILIERLREILAQYPYVINFTFHFDVSSPHLNYAERDNQEKILSTSLATFSKDLQSLKPESLSFTKNTEAFSYEIVDIRNSGRGYPGILLSSSSISLDHSFPYLTLRIHKKAEKRISFPPAQQNVPYLIAIVCDEPGIETFEVKELLFGSTVHYGLNQDNSVYRAIREKNWAAIIKELHQQSFWPEIQRAKESGWEDLLSETYLFPNEYCYVKEPGLYLSSPLMKQVDGMLFCSCSRKTTVFPNPFSNGNTIKPPFWKNVL